MTALADPPVPAPARPRPARPLLAAASLAAVWAAAVGLAALTTIVLVGWIAAPHPSLGEGLPGVFRTAAQLWLVGHHAGFSLPQGRVGMLPLGLVVLPGLLLYRAGGWLVRGCEVTRLRHVGGAALALALPYGGLCAMLALGARTPLAEPSVTQALLAGFLVALVAGGIGAARALAPWWRLLGLLPPRPRSLVVGTVGAAAVLLGAGAVLAGTSLALHHDQARELAETLSPGVVGGVLLILLQVVFVPNAVLWGVAYLVGPGFAVGTDSQVSPTGVLLGDMPAFPLLAAVPGPGAGNGLAVALLAVPYLAGVVGGVLMARTAPTPVAESVPFWGFACGGLTGLAVGALAAFSGGPLGGGRLASVGPSGWQVALVAVLEIGVAAAVAGWVTNAVLLRRGGRGRAAAAGAARGTGGAGAPPGAGAGGTEAAADRQDRQDRQDRKDRPGDPAIVDETDDQGGHRIYVDPWADEDGWDRS